MCQLTHRLVPTRFVGDAFRVAWFQPCCWMDDVTPSLGKLSLSFQGWIDANLTGFVLVQLVTVVWFPPGETDYPIKNCSCEQRCTGRSEAMKFHPHGSVNDCQGVMRTLCPAYCFLRSAVTSSIDCTAITGACLDVSSCLHSHYPVVLTPRVDLLCVSVVLHDAKQDLYHIIQMMMKGKKRRKGKKTIPRVFEKWAKPASYTPREWWQRHHACDKPGWGPLFASASSPTTHLPRPCGLVRCLRQLPLALLGPTYDSTPPLTFRLPMT